MMPRPTRLIIAGCAVLGLQAVLTAAWSWSEYLPSPPPLSSLPSELGPWRVVAERSLDPDAVAMLSPDDLVNRIYTRPDDTGDNVDLFVAYYKSQHRAKSAHDPKVCLPGSGWIAIDNTTVRIPVPETGTVILANHYLMEKGPEKNLVIYWFQTLGGTTPEVHELRLANLFTSVRKKRSDMALVRIIVAVDTADPKSSSDSADAFARLLYPALTRYFPTAQAGG